jgi:hypothetical protein
VQAGPGVLGTTPRSWLRKETATSGCGEVSVIADFVPSQK